MTPETFEDLNIALDHAARGGTPHGVDWAHREVHFRILARAFRTLDRPLSDLEALLPEEFEAIPEPVRAAIPGNAPLNAKVIRSNLLRARGAFRPDLYPWDAVIALAEPAIPTFMNAWTPIRRTAAATGVAHPCGLTSVWVADQLADVTVSNETYRRGLFAMLVRASKAPAIREAGLLRPDLRLPPTLRAAQRLVALPGWLQDIHGSSDRQTQNAISRAWRTVLHHGWPVDDAGELLRLIDEGHLSHAAANVAEAIKPVTWTTYRQALRRALVSRSGRA